MSIDVTALPHDTDLEDEDELEDDEAEELLDEEELEEAEPEPEPEPTPSPWMEVFTRPDFNDSTSYGVMTRFDADGVTKQYMAWSYSGDDPGKRFESAIFEACDGADVHIPEWVRSAEDESRYYRAAVHIREHMQPHQKSPLDMEHIAKELHGDAKVYAREWWQAEQLRIKRMLDDEAELKRVRGLVRGFQLLMQSTHEDDKGLIDTLNQLFNQ